MKRSERILAKQSLGQNFLVAPLVVEDILDGADIRETDLVVEIGPGRGALTEGIAQRARRVIAIEIDQRLIPSLRGRMAPYDNIDIVQGDILQIDLRSRIEDVRKEDPGIGRVLVIGNLPYYITTPILMNLLENRVPVAGIVVMMQREVAERIGAEPGTRAYGALTIAVQYYCHVNALLSVPGSAFRPRPKVDSRVLRLDLRESAPVQLRDEDLFFRLVRAGFGQRRKTLQNSLAGLDGRSKEQIGRLLSRVDVDPARRAETLTMEEFARLANALAEGETKEHE